MNALSVACRLALAGLLLCSVHPGAAAGARIEQTPHPDLASAALRALEVMRFQPAVRHGQVTSVWVTIPIQFALPA